MGELVHLPRQDHITHRGTERGDDLPGEQQPVIARRPQRRQIERERAQHAGQLRLARALRCQCINAVLLDDGFDQSRAFFRRRAFQRGQLAFSAREVRLQAALEGLLSRPHAAARDAVDFFLLLLAPAEAKSPETTSDAAESEK